MMQNGKEAIGVTGFPKIGAAEAMSMPAYASAAAVRRPAGLGDLSVITAVPAYAQATVMGTPLAACTMTELVETVEAWVDSGGTYSATGVNSYVINKAGREPSVKALLEGNSLNYVDGQSVVWASRMLGLDVPERVATTDLIYPLAEMAARRGFGLYFLGAKQEIVERAAQRLMDQYPGLKVHTHHGYITAADDAAVLADIAASGARIVLVGMGDPKQQQWVRDHRDLVPANVLLTCGGLFDWVSGANPRPPQWMVTSGLEWAWRVYIEPRRLMGRYLVGNPEFIGRFAAALVRRLRRR